MRLAIISDIHGNTPALDAVLRDLGRTTVDRLVCLGDVAAGPDPAECIDRIARTGCTVVMGNADAAILRAPTIPQNASERRRRLMEIWQWCGSVVPSHLKASVERYEQAASIDLGERGSLLCVHGSPRSFEESILPGTPEEDILAMLGNTHHSFIVAGHTHQQMLRRLPGRTLLNPGSVGYPFESRKAGELFHPSWAEYALLEMHHARVDVHLRRVAYPLTEIQRTIRSSGMPHAEWYLQGWGLPEEARPTHQH